MSEESPQINRADRQASRATSNSTPSESRRAAQHTRSTRLQTWGRHGHPQSTKDGNNNLQDEVSYLQCSMKADLWEREEDSRESISKLGQETDDNKFLRGIHSC